MKGCQKAKKMEVLIGNAVVGQSGGPTAAINATLSGVIKGAFKAKEKGIINTIYGMRNGIEGLLEERLVNLTESLVCPGYRTLYGHQIHCHQTTGHGTLSFPEGLQQSCNVWFMELGGRLGVEKYQNYVEMFGYTEKTGIDLPGEGSGIFSSQMTDLDVAIYAFGQNFNVTPMQQLVAIASVANGGKLVTPYIVEKITDNAGNVILQHKTNVKRGTVSAETCETLAKILEEGVSNNGGAKNAYVAGYKVAAKTGTAEKKERECPRCGYTGVPTEVIDDIQYYACSVCSYVAGEDEFEVSEK